MAKNLVVCCDGTWNTPVQKDRGKIVTTNVVKIYQAATDDEGQKKYYDKGVGTGSWADKYTGGMFGIGLTDNIKQAYYFIADNYEDGDKIFLFGFSRGAYTVRSLAGMIGRCGLTAPGDRKAARHAYALYREAKTDRGKARAAIFKERQRRPEIHFLGVWDTVGALGVPALSKYGLLRKLVRKVTEGSKYAHGFHDESLGNDVVHAYHAVAVDERRGPFAPSVWKKNRNDSRHNVEQMWFAGVHCNVGGGYADEGLSDITLLWIAEKAKGAGLMMTALSDARPDHTGELRDSMAIFYRAFPKHVRAIGDPNTLNEAIHHTVIERRGHSKLGYNPENLSDAVIRLLSKGRKQKAATESVPEPVA